MRPRFKRSRFDDVHSRFPNVQMVDTLLDRFMCGSIGVDELWKGISQEQRGRLGPGAAFETIASTGSRRELPAAPVERT